MKLNSYWYYFTLLAVTQLSLVLLGVVCLFQWFETAKADAVRANALSSTLAVATQMSNSLKLQSRETGESKTVAADPSVTRLSDSISSFEPASGGFVCVLSATDGGVVYHKTRLSSPVNRGLGSQPFQPIGLDLKQSSLLEVFENQPDLNSVSGVLSIGGQKWWGSACKAKSGKAIVVVAQSEEATLQHGSVVFAQGRTRTLVLAALLGFFAIAIPVTGLYHYDNNLRAVNSDLERQATHNERELVRTRNAVIFGLAKLAESRDNDTGEHLDRIRTYVEILSKDLAHHISGIDDKFTRNLSLASSLHDIGKVGIPDSILLKPGRLTPEERAVMQIHTVIGGECLDAIHARLGDNPFMHMARQIAYYHHERWDGGGYPHQLSGDEIPLVARIVAVADVYDALTSKRPYKRAMSHLESRAIIQSGSGSQFDPEIVAAFMRHEHEFEAISLGQQNLSDDEATSRFVKLHELASAGAGTGSGSTAQPV